MRTISSMLCVALLSACPSSDDHEPRADAGARDDDAGQQGADGGRVVGPADCNLPPESGQCEAYFERWHHDASTGQCALFIYGGCGGNANNFETLAACEEACDVTPAATPCMTSASSDSLPGVKIEIEAPRCNFAVGQGGEFRWQVTVDEPIAYQTEASQGCGACKAWGGEVASLVSYRIGDNDVHYCECDVGCCVPDTSMAYTLKAGSAEGVVRWPGKRWNGPSDTQNKPEGTFPAGSYDVDITLALPGAGTLTAKLPIVVE
jgi:hypothetical protein